MIQDIQKVLTHEKIWAAVDALAEKNRLSISGLARNAGLDPTSFNKSKRVTADNRLRWPSTESIAKALKCTNTPVEEFFQLMNEVSSSSRRQSFPTYRQRSAHRNVPLIGFAQAGVGGFFDDGGFPVGQGWEEIDFPFGGSETSYALKVSGDSMLPLYRDGDVIVVDPAVQVRKGDRVVAKTIQGEVLAKQLERNSTKEIVLKSVNPDHENRSFSPEELEWIARIIWASQ